jgi:putative Ca2+/H+ antiporter (TMEM165/GDT1 family)
MSNCALHDLRNQIFRVLGDPGAWPVNDAHDAGHCRTDGPEKGMPMDWRVTLTTFGIIFLAELGDKTQIAAMTMAAQKKRPWEVFVGASLALVAVSAIGVVIGSALGHYLPLDWIKRVAGAAFIVIGVLVLIGKF